MSIKRNENEIRLDVLIRLKELDIGPEYDEGTTCDKELCALLFEAADNGYIELVKRINNVIRLWYNL